MVLMGVHPGHQILNNLLLLQIVHVGCIDTDFVMWPGDRLRDRESITMRDTDSGWMNGMFMHDIFLASMIPDGWWFHKSYGSWHLSIGNNKIANFVKGGAAVPQCGIKPLTKYQSDFAMREYIWLERVFICFRALFPGEKVIKNFKTIHKEQRKLFPTRSILYPHVNAMNLIFHNNNYIITGKMIMEI